MHIGFTEILVILAVALIVLGPDKMPGYMKKFGRALREVKKYTSELTEDLKENVIAPLDEAQRPLREAIEPLEAMDKELKSSVRELENAVKGKSTSVKAEKPEAPAAEPAAEPEKEETTTTQGEM